MVHLYCWSFTRESACIPGALGVKGIATSPAFYLPGPVFCCMGFWTGVACSVRLSRLAHLSVSFLCFLLFVLFPFSFSSVVGFSLLIEILLPLLYMVSLSYPKVGMGLGLLDFFVDHGLVPFLPRLCTVRPGHHVTSWRTMEPFACLACTTVMTGYM